MIPERYWGEIEHSEGNKLIGTNSTLTLPTVSLAKQVNKWVSQKMYGGSKFGKKDYSLIDKEIFKQWIPDDIWKTSWNKTIFKY